MPNCSRCGREISTGMYCESCHFYIYNEQCWRCRMYLPKVELQQWRGQTYCPYCIQDLRDEEKDVEEKMGEREREKGAAGEKRQPGAEEDDSQGSGGSGESRGSSYVEGGTPPDSGAGGGVGQKNHDYACDRCREDLDVVYIVADYKFCELCFQQERRQWSDEGIKPPPHMKFRIKENPGFFTSFLRFLKRKIREEWEKRKKKKD